MDWTNTSRTLLMTGAAAIGLICANPALAQQQVVPPEHYSLDERGVDLVRGQFVHVAEEVVIGQPANGGLTYGRVYTGDGWRDLLSGTIITAGSRYTVSLGGISEVFFRSGSTFTPQSNRGATLVQSGNQYIFTSSDGTVAVYNTLLANTTNPWPDSHALIESITQPAGERVNFNYSTMLYCADNPPGPDCQDWREALRLQSVNNNRGYQVNFSYQTPGLNDPPDVFFRRTGAGGVNLAVEYCNPNGSICSGTNHTWPSVTYSAGTAPFEELVTDQSGRTTTYRFSSANAFRMTGLRLPGSTADDVTMTYTGSGQRLASMTIAGSTWGYATAETSGTRTVTTTNPGGSTTVAVADTSLGRLTSLRNEMLQTTTFEYDSQRRLERTILPEGNYAQYGYDSRGNVTSVTQVPKSGSGLSNIVTTAAYPSTCSNPVICNQPTSVTDARGATTNFTYDPTHGGPLTITAPAPTTGTPRPQTRFEYWTTRAWYYTAPGTISSAPTQVTLPRETRACVTGASCANAVNEVVTTVSYGSGGTTTPTNRLPTSVNQRSGTSSVTATTAFTYTPNSDVASVDGPLSGTTDTTYYRYDAARQLIGVIGPDPDGTGPLLRRAQRLTYNPRGQVTLTEQGTVTGLTDPNWAAFATLQRQANQYDTYGRPTHTRVQSSNGTTRALTQVSYDARGRVDCVTARMNPTTFATPPAACSLGTTGTFGQDRIVRYVYDAASRITSLTSGHNSSAPITQNFTWTNNGQRLTARDGDGNLSTWVYDGFDRVFQLRFPATTGGTSSATDYEEYSYDANSNIVGFRTRANQRFYPSYDALNRQTFLNAPGTLANTTYAYDNLSRPTSISQPGHAVTYAWDALNRLTSQTDPLGTFGFQYDAAGRRTRIIWPDAFYAQYDWNLYSQVTAVRENGASSGAGVLAQYAYDNLGRRTGITRGNGVPTNYGYDDVSRLTSIVHNLAGTAHDVTFTMGYNPASQVTSRTISNSLYAYAPTNESTAYTINGRNEINTAGGTTFTYDANRNLTNDGVRSYTYDAANRMTSAAGVVFTYDPLGQPYGYGATSLMTVGGERLGMVTNSTGALYRRLVPGAAMDELATYNSGAGTGARYWPLTDHQNSVVGLSNASAASIGTNTYDEYGRPGAGNVEFVQYTGQLTVSATWGLYNYRNRFYNAQIGRFMQTDPIGYGDGLNLYAYVRNDPMNRVDPWGLNSCWRRNPTTGVWECEINEGVVCDRQCRLEDFARREQEWAWRQEQLRRLSDGGYLPTDPQFAGPQPPWTPPGPDLRCAAWSLGSAMNEAGQLGGAAGVGIGGIGLVVAGGAMADLQPDGVLIGGAMVVAGTGIAAVSSTFGALGAGVQFFSGDRYALLSVPTALAAAAPFRGIAKQTIGFLSGQGVDRMVSSRRVSPC